MTPELRAQYVTLARENARTKHALGMEHAETICELCARAKASNSANDRLGLVAQVVQGRSHNRQVWAATIERMTGTRPEAAMVYPLGEPKANAQVLQAEVYTPATTPTTIEPSDQRPTKVNGNDHARAYRSLAERADDMAKTIDCDDWDLLTRTKVRFTKTTPKGGQRVVLIHDFA